MGAREEVEEFERVCFVCPVFEETSMSRFRKYLVQVADFGVVCWRRFFRRWQRAIEGALLGLAVLLAFSCQFLTWSIR